MFTACLINFSCTAKGSFSLAYLCITASITLESIPLEILGQGKFWHLLYFWNIPHTTLFLTIFHCHLLSNWDRVLVSIHNENLGGIIAAILKELWIYPYLNSHFFYFYFIYYFLFFYFAYCFYTLLFKLDWKLQRFSAKPLTV